MDTIADYQVDIAQQNFWDRKRFRRSPNHPAIKAFAEPKVDFIKSCIGDRIERILDVGCGNGYFTQPLARWAKCTALDFSGWMLKQNPVDAEKVCGDVCLMPFPDNSFDLVVCSNLLHHVTKPEIAVKEMARVSSGYVAFSEPNRNNPLMFLFGLLKAVERGTLKFSYRHLAGLAEGANLKILSRKTMGLILPNKTPKWLLWLDGEFPLAFFNVLVTKKK